MGAALTYKEVYGDEVVLKVAAITKLTRNVFLAGVIPAIAWSHKADAGVGAPTKLTLAGVKKYIPMFVVGFVGIQMVRCFCATRF